jgi:hypothetical protein
MNFVPCKFVTKAMCKNGGKKKEKMCMIANESACRVDEGKRQKKSDMQEQNSWNLVYAAC